MMLVMMLMVRQLMVKHLKLVAVLYGEPFATLRRCFPGKGGQMVSRKMHLPFLHNPGTAGLAGQDDR